MGKLFGEYIRERREALCREDPRYSIRKVAERIRVHHSYLSKIERGEPGSLSEKKVVALAHELGESPDLLLAMNGRISNDIARVVLQQPDLFREIIDKLRDLCGKSAGNGTAEAEADGDRCLDMLVRINQMLGGEVDSLMRHELRSPLAGIVSGVNLLLNEDGLSEGMRKLLLEIRDSGKRLLRVVDGSLTLALVESGKYQVRPVPVDLVEVLGQVCRDHDDLARRREVTVRVLVDGQEPGQGRELLVLGSRRLCYGVVSHLVRNALDASPTGREVTVRAVSDGACTLSVHNEGEVPEQARERFFEKFFTHGKEDGVGLGTYAARRLAEAMGGAVELMTGDGHGTTVTVRLPLA